MLDLKFKGNSDNSIEQSTILIIEDDSFQRTFLRKLFESQGFTNIIEAADGKEGLHKTVETKPDLVLLDINMPVMDGLEYCKTIRDHPNHKDTTILVQTGLSDTNDKAKIFAAGATDYVTKPIDIREVFARVFIHLEKNIYIKNIEKFNNRIKEELASAKRLIEMSLPEEKHIHNLSKKYGIDLASIFESSYEMGGDFWGFKEINKSQLAIYCLDFSGHGIDSSLNVLRLHSLLHTKSAIFHSPEKVLTWLNKQLVELLRPGYFATMFYGVIDISENVLLYATAATPSPLLINGNSWPGHSIDGQGFPLGVFKNATYSTKTIPFNKGDTLILYSDALPEASYGSEILGEQRLMEIFKNFTDSKKASSSDALQYFMEKFKEVCPEKLEDDLTINVYQRM